MQQHWGRGWWGIWCRDPDLPWHRRLDKHRGSPPRSAGGPQCWGAGPGWKMWTDSGYSGSELPSEAAGHELGQEKTMTGHTTKWSVPSVTVHVIFVLELTKVWDRQHLHGVVVVEFIPFMSPVADIAVNVSVEPVVPTTWQNITRDIWVIW